jgi:aspartate/methionine/tyrosine aminotransferase
MAYRYCVELAGRTPVFVDTYPDFRLTAERVARAITPRTKMLVFSSPSNPTGTVLDERTLRELAAVCAEHGVLIVSDEIYEEFCHAPTSRGGRMCAPSVGSISRDVVILRGFSKTYFRLSFACDDDTLDRGLDALLSYALRPAAAATSAVDAHAATRGEYT